MDIFETVARVLAMAVDGATHTRVATLNPHLAQDELRQLLQLLVGNNLLEHDSSTYWTTVEGVKFLEIHLYMEQMLQGQKSLV